MKTRPLVAASLLMAALNGAAPSILSTGLSTLETRIGSVLPAGVTVGSTLTDLTVTVGAVSLGWNPTAHRVTVSGNGVLVPGIDQLTFQVAVDDVGLDGLSVTFGPAAIDEYEDEVKLSPLLFLRPTVLTRAEGPLIDLAEQLRRVALAEPARTPVA